MKGKEPSKIFSFNNNFSSCVQFLARTHSTMATLSKTEGVRTIHTSLKRNERKAVGTKCPAPADVDMSIYLCISDPRFFCTSIILNM